MVISRYLAKALLLLLILCGSLTQPLQGQYYFGRNKIQYEPFQWHVLNTPHFNIYYYSEEEDIAQAAAVFAEEAFDRLEQKFNHTIDEQIPLVIYSNHIHFQQTNVILNYIPEGVGGFFEFMKRRVVLPYLGSMDAFRHVVNHELVHVFMHHKVYAHVRHVRSTDVPAIPLWFTEGLAEAWSTDWDSQAELIIRDAVLNDYLLPLDSYALMSAGFLLYKQGQSFLEYYESTYSADRIRSLLETYWKYENFSEAISAISDAEFTSIESDWRQYLKKTFAASLSEDELLSHNEYQVTRQGANIRPTVSQDSSGRAKIHYISSRGGYLNIYQQELAFQAEAELVVRGERKASRESLHFLRTGIHINSNGMLVYVAKQGPRDVLRIFDTEKERDVRTLQHPDLVTLTSPKWSPDNRWITFSAQDFGGQEDIYLWDLSNDVLLQLVDDPYSDRDPAFGPDGRNIVFSSDRGNLKLDASRDIFLYNLDTQTMTSLTADSSINVQPVWSWDDPQRLYYLSDGEGTANIWELRMEATPNGWISRGTRPRTRFHTGFEDLTLLNPDTLVVTVFQDYGFQIRQLPLPADTAAFHTTNSEPLHAAGSWELHPGIINSAEDRQPYKLNYTLDFAQAAVANDPIFGFQGGAQLGISDLLGNRYFNFLIDNTAQTSSDFLTRFNLAVTMVDLTRRANRALSVFRFANEYFDPYQGFYFEEAVGARVGLSYPIDVFNRLEFSTSLWSSHKEYVFDDPDDAVLTSSFISYVHDNSLWTYTGPLDGWRMRVMVGPTFNFLNSRFHNYTALVDLRTYWRLNSKLTFAQRSMVWLNDGTDIRRFYIGGSWGLRGYRIQEVYGRRYVMFNQELRFPFANSFALGFNRFAIGVAPIRGALFLDAGNAWDGDFPGMIGSLGVGLRGVFLGGLVLRLDFGRKTDFTRIENQWFTQFFFGWDF